MFNSGAFEQLKMRQPLMAQVLKQLGENYLHFAQSQIFDAKNLRRFYTICDNYHLFRGIDPSVKDVKDMISYIS